MDIDVSKLPRYRIFCIDFRSFYASVESVLRGLDPVNTYLAVVGDLSRRGSVCLAASPLMKSTYGIKTGSRLYQIPTDPKIHIVEARMNTYLDVSMQATRILKRFVPMECISVYSIDESFVTLDHNLFGDNWEFARTIQNVITVELGLPTAVGVGQNLFQSKACLDMLSKKNAKTGYIDEVTYETFAEKLWHFPVRESWGIGHRMERNLSKLGIRTIGDLANANLPTLKASFGVIGEQMFYHARGIDLTCPYHKPEMSQHAIVQKGFGSGVTLLRDYHDREEVVTGILDQTEEVCRRAREVKMNGRTISLAIGYSDDVGGGGFSKARTIDTPTNLTQKVFQVCKELFYENDIRRAVRNIHVGLTNLSPDDIAQLDLFEDDTKGRQLAAAMDAIRRKHGAASLTWARSVTEGGIAIERASKVGGHKA